jgi:H+/gluconate symporter-like permease
MEWIGVLGIIVALTFFIVAAMRGYSVMITAPLTAIIIILTNQLDFTQTFLSDPSSSYLAGLAGFIQKNLLIFLLSAILGKYIDASGAAKSIANVIMKRAGKENPFWILVGVAAVAAVLTYGGISLFVVMFALIPLARPLFKECNIPWHLFVAAFALGATSFTMGMIPGSPAAANVVAANGCGVTVTSAPILGILSTLIVIVFSLFYFKRILIKAKNKGETYDCQLPEMTYTTDRLPNVIISLAPLAVLIVVIFIGSAFAVPNIVYIAMVIAIILSAVFFHSYVGGQHKNILGDGAKDSFAPTLFTAAGVGIGSVIAASSGFSVIQDTIFNMPGGPYVSAAALSGALGGIVGSGTGALGIVTGNFIEPYMTTGASAAVLYKVITIAATTGGALPNSGSMFGMLNAMGLNHKVAYKHFFWISIVAQFLALVVAIILGSLGIA